MKTNEVDEVILFHKVKNEMPASAATAPYLGKIEPRGTLDEETFIAEMREDGCTESTETIRRILRGADAVQTRRIGEKGNKVQTGAELMMPHLTGTLPTPDAKPGDDNELTVRIDPDDGLRNALSDLTPKENREDLSKLGGVRIYSVKSEGLDWSVLKGTQPFQIAGIGFRPTATATVEVKVVSRKTGDAATATATCEDNQRITAQLGEVLAKGDYKVVVTVTDEGGLSGNTEASYNVKMLAAPQPPAPTPPIATSPDGSAVVRTFMGETSVAEAGVITGDALGDIRFGGEGLARYHWEQPHFICGDGTDVQFSDLEYDEASGELSCGLGSSAEILPEGVVTGRFEFGSGDKKIFIEGVKVQKE